MKVVYQDFMVFDFSQNYDFYDSQRIPTAVFSDALQLWLVSVNLVVAVMARPAQPSPAQVGPAVPRHT